MHKRTRLALAVLVGIAVGVAATRQLGRAFADGVPSPKPMTYTGTLLNNGAPVTSATFVGLTFYDQATGGNILSPCIVTSTSMLFTKICLVRVFSI